MTARVSRNFGGNWLALFAGLVALWAPSAAFAQDAPAPPPGAFLTIEDVSKNWDKLTPTQQFAALEQLLRAGEFATAKALLERAHYTATNDQLIHRFYTGVIAKAEGRPDEAIAIYRELLANHPEFERVRLELAQTLFQVQQDDSARHNFELMLGGASTNPDLANTARAYIDAIDGRRLWDLSSYVTIAPSTNFNQGTSNGVVMANGLPFAVAERNLQKSGIGVAFGLQGSYRFPVNDRLDLIASGGFNGRRYQDGIFNDALLNASFGPRTRFDWGTLGLYATAERRWTGDEDYYHAFGGQLSGVAQLSHQDIVFSDAACSARRFSQSWQATDLTYQNGTVCSLSERWEHHWDSVTYTNLLAGAARERAGVETLDDISWSVGAGVYRELPLGVSVYAQGLYTRKDYAGIYPTTTAPRRDDRFDATLNLTKRDLVILSLAPTLGLTYTLNDSNVAFQQYDAYGANITLTKRF